MVIDEFVQKLNELAEENGSTGVDVEDSILTYLSERAVGRMNDLSFMVSLYIPWMRYIQNPEESNEDYPHCVERYDAPGQPWSIAGGDVIQPDEASVLKAMKQWLKEVYEQYKAAIGNTPLPNFYNVTYGGEVLVQYGQYWVSATEEQLIKVASDTKTARVLHIAIKEGYIAPLWKEFFAIWSADYESAEQRAGAVSKIFGLETPSPEREISLTDMLRDAVTGKGGEVSLTNDELSWHFDDDETKEFVAKKLGVKSSALEPQPWYNDWLNIKKHADAGEFDAAIGAAKLVMEKLYEHDI